MTTNGERLITLGGKSYTLQPFTLRQMKEVAKMARALGDPEEAAEAGFAIMAMALQNATPKIDGDVEDLHIEADELADVMAKVQKLAGISAKKEPEQGEATALTPGA